MARIGSHRDLIVWQKAMDLTVDVYRFSQDGPSDERFRLTSQVLRAVASVPANIAEGHARGSRKDYAHFLAVAKGSLMEVDTFLDLALRLGFSRDDQTRVAQCLITEISKMITAVRARLLDD